MRVVASKTFMHVKLKGAELVWEYRIERTTPTQLYVDLPPYVRRPLRWAPFLTERALSYAAEVVVEFPGGPDLRSAQMLEGSELFAVAI